MKNILLISLIIFSINSLYATKKIQDINRGISNLNKIKEQLSKKENEIIKLNKIYIDLKNEIIKNKKHKKTFEGKQKNIHDTSTNILVIFKFNDHKKEIFKILEGYKYNHRENLFSFKLNNVKNLTHKLTNKNIEFALYHINFSTGKYYINNGGNKKLKQGALNNYKNKKIPDFLK